MIIQNMHEHGNVCQIEILGMVRNVKSVLCVCVCVHVCFVYLQS